MGTKRNLRVQLDAEIIRKARVLAVQRSISVSRLIAEQLEHLVNDEDQYCQAEQAALADLDARFHLGGGKLPLRADIHER